MAGLPFVFAARISNKELDSGWVDRFDLANAAGVQNMATVVNQLPDKGLDLKNILCVFSVMILMRKTKKALKLFLELLADK
jgi:chorismate dehydratase